MGKVRIGVIGGSGLYKMPGVSNVREQRLTTPFGDPSDAYFIGDLEGHPELELVFLPRHGRGHVHNPSEVNYRANIFGMKVLGVSWIVAISAVGSLQENIVPGEFVLVDQFIDRTKGRNVTFFENGVVAHVGFSQPTCTVVRSFLEAACRRVGVKVHPIGTYVNMEGPAFSTVAESHLYRSWGGHVIGMTALAEAKLAREAEISYGVLAMATDYDCWRGDHDAVDVQQVMATIEKNVHNAQAVIKTVAPLIAAHEGPCPFENALQGAIMTAPEKIPESAKRALEPIIGKYAPASKSCPFKALGVFAFVAVVLPFFDLWC